MQLTNILRDVREDRDRGRIYLPLEDMVSFGYTEADLAAGIVNENLGGLMRFEVARWVAALPGGGAWPAVDSGRWVSIDCGRQHGRDLQRNTRRHREAGLQRVRGPRSTHGIPEAPASSASVGHIAMTPLPLCHGDGSSPGANNSGASEKIDRNDSPAAAFTDPVAAGPRRLALRPGARRI